MVQGTTGVGKALSFYSLSGHNSRGPARSGIALGPNKRRIWVWALGLPFREFIFVDITEGLGSFFSTVVPHEGTGDRTPMSPSGWSTCIWLCSPLLPLNGEAPGVAWRVHGLVRRESTYIVRACGTKMATCSNFQVQKCQINMGHGGSRNSMEFWGRKGEISFQSWPQRGCQAHGVLTDGAEVQKPMRRKPSFWRGCRFLPTAHHLELFSTSSGRRLVLHMVGGARK